MPFKFIREFVVEFLKYVLSMERKYIKINVYIPKSVLFFFFF